MPQSPKQRTRHPEFFAELPVGRRLDEAFSFSCASGFLRGRMTQMTKRERIGEIGVDAGLCWIGDRSYVLHAQNLPNDIGKNWADFCSRLGKRCPTKKQFNYDLGHPGLGMCVSTGYGDGVYLVYAEYHDGHIARVVIEFIDDEEGD
jgi:hypothetical protein